MEMVKFLASGIMGILGSYYIYRGLKIQNPKMILIGAVLIVLSYVPFMGGGDDKASQDAIKNLLPQATEQTTPNAQLP